MVASCLGSAVALTLGVISGCGRPAGPVTTSYFGSVTTSSVDCTTGASTGPGSVAMNDLSVEYRSDVDTYWLAIGDESCTVAFLPDTDAATSFTLYPGALCERSELDGSRVRFEFTSGTMERNGDALTGTYDVRITTPPGATDGCVERHVTFTATRT
jgi:hypothetical protein